MRMSLGFLFSFAPFVGRGVAGKTAYPRQTN